MENGVELNEWRGKKRKRKRGGGGPAVFPSWGREERGEKNRGKVFGIGRKKWGVKGNFGRKREEWEGKKIEGKMKSGGWRRVWEEREEVGG